MTDFSEERINNIDVYRHVYSVVAERCWAHQDFFRKIESSNLFEYIDELILELSSTKVKPIEEIEKKIDIRLPRKFRRILSKLDKQEDSFMNVIKKKNIDLTLLKTQLNNILETSNDIIQMACIEMEKYVKHI